VTGPPAAATAPFVLDLPGGERIVGDRLAGAPPCYLFLHGLGSVRKGEKSGSLLAHAAAHGRAFTRFDFRGHGESSGRIGHVTIGELVDDTVLVLERVGPAVVVGSSLGGLVGAHAAARRPDLVPALALLAPALGFLPRLERRLDAAGRLWTSEGFGFRVEPRVLEDAARLDEAGLPARLSMPVLVVHGERDDVVPPRLGESFFAAIPHARKELWLVPGGDHRLVREAPAIWARLDALVARSRPDADDSA
jgi:pimeloyl-ACP methyl ester carboxylesterase